MVASQRCRAAMLLAAVLTMSCLGPARAQTVLRMTAQVRPTPGITVAPLQEGEQQLARDILQQLIEIDTSHAGGSTTPAAEAMRQRFLDAGFPASDIEIVGPKSDRMNLVVRYRAAALPPAEDAAANPVAKKPVLLMGHLDVVNAPRAEWTVEPFKLAETDGYFYGRGTQDMKNSDAAWVASFLLLKNTHALCFSPAFPLVKD